MNLRRFEDRDIALVKKWLQESYVARWFTPQDAWMEEIMLRHTKYSFITHFIAEIDGQPIGFCQYYDYSQGEEDWNGSIPCEGSYSIDYFIGNPVYLGHGHGTTMVKLLVEKVMNCTEAKRIIVQPESENNVSRKTLLAAGFVYNESDDLYLYDLRKQAIDNRK